MFQIALSFLTFLSLGAFAEPAGYATKEELKKILKGDILIDSKVKSEVREYKGIFRYAINVRDVSDYLTMITNHKKYKDYFEEVADSKTLESNREKTVFKYWLQITMKVLGFPITTEAVLKQRVGWPKDATSEGRVETEMVSFKDQLDFGFENTRIFPYQEGTKAVILLHDVYNFQFAKDFTMPLICSEADKQIKRIVTTFRSALTGEKK